MAETGKKCCAKCRHFGGGADTVLPCLAPIPKWVEILHKTLRERFVNPVVINAARLMVGREGGDCPAYDAAEKTQQ